MHEIMEDMSWWLKEKRSGIWERPLQAEETVVKGWLLYSHRNIDTEILAAVLEAKLKSKIGLRYRAIYSGVKLCANTEPVRALHIQVDKQDSAKVDPVLNFL